MSKAKFNILLVDDRPDSLMSLKAALAHPEYNLVGASSGREALARLLDDDFVVILMDIMMPEMDGLETAALIKQRPRSRDIPIIFVTAIGSDFESVNSAYKVGAVDYLYKPFEPDILRSKVAVFVELHRRKLELERKNLLLREMESRNQVQLLERLERESLRRYRNLANAVPHIIWGASDVGLIEYVNQTWTDLTGLCPNQSSGMGWKEALLKSDCDDLIEKWRLASHAKTAFEANVRIQSIKTGKHRWFLVRGVPESEHLEPVTSWILTATDIDDHVVVEKELQAAKEAADAASLAKSRFLANMSHEIRTPLGAVLGFTDLLASSELSNEERYQYLETIRRNGKLLSKIINEVLDLSKIEAGRLELESIAFNARDLFQDIWALMSHSAKEKGLKLDIEFLNSVPEVITTDPTRLKQILVNIVGNAIKFSSKGAVLLQVDWQAGSTSDGGDIIVSVTDTGPGLSAEQVSQLFRPFTQADVSTTRKYGGTGLGLALSRSFAEAMGGALELVHSEVGKGSTFKLRIPVIVEQGASAFAEIPKAFLTGLEPNAKEGLSDLRDLRILLADDSPDNQFLIGRFLRAAGAEVEFANNGVEAFEKALLLEHDLVLMDIQMPEMDGLEATIKLRESGYVKPIVALTAYALKEDKDRCLAAGCDDYLTKPVNRAELLFRVSNLRPEIDGKNNFQKAHA